jgi:hypothetical protein
MLAHDFKPIDYIVSRPFWITKRGNLPDEYEDAFFPIDARVLCRGNTMRWAVADGASEAILSSEWANILVKTFCEDDRRNIETHLKEVTFKACLSYQDWLNDYLAKRRKSSNPVQWYEETKIQMGTFSTLMGLEISISLDGIAHWNVVSVGDCNLFVVRGSKIIKGYPYDASSMFNNHPALLCSKVENNEEALGRACFESAVLEKGDTLLIATDAFAAWFLKSVELGSCPQKIIKECIQDFDVAIQRARTLGEMRNDDVTLTCIEVI